MQVGVSEWVGNGRLPLILRSSEAEELSKYQIRVSRGSYFFVDGYFTGIVH